MMLHRLNLNRITSLAIIVVLTGCTFFSDESTKKRIDDGVKVANDTLRDTYARDRLAFDRTYSIVLKKTTDTSQTQSLLRYHSVLIETLKLSDSLKMVLGKVDDHVPSNNNAVRKVFIDEKKGDELFRKLKLSFIATDKIALTDKRKAEIASCSKNILGESNSTEKINDLFTFNGPESASWVLYGIEQEVVEIGIKTLQDQQK